MQYDPQGGWEYEKHPLYETVKIKCIELIQGLAQDNLKCNEVITDTRESHLHVYRDVTPDGHSYFAGNYRGFPAGYLEDYNVTISRYSGAPAAQVDSLMQDFSERVLSLLDSFDRLIQNTADTTKSLLHYCRLLAWIFTKFLVIHPYANGNGHMARLLVWALLRRKGLSADFWSVADRPGVPRGEPLDSCIEHFRNQNEGPLVKYFLLGILNKKPVTANDLAGVLTAR